jgi:hypothetical protein
MIRLSQKETSLLVKWKYNQPFQRRGFFVHSIFHGPTLLANGAGQMDYFHLLMNGGALARQQLDNQHCKRQILPTFK